MNPANRSAVTELLNRISAADAQSSLLELLGDAPVSERVPEAILCVLWSQDVGISLRSCHEPMTLADVVSNKSTMVDMLAAGDFDDPTGDTIQETEPGDEQPWWSAHWWPFLSDGAGQLICWDSVNNEVVEFLHDDPCRETLFQGSPAAFLADMVVRVDEGRAEWRGNMGFLTSEQIARQDAFEARRAQREQQQRKDGARFARNVGVVCAVVGVFAGVVWWVSQSMV